MNQTKRVSSPAEIRDRIIRELKETSDAVFALRTPPFKIKEVFNLLIEIVSMIEAFAPAHMNGATKRAIANGVIRWIDGEFKVTQIIYRTLFGGFFLFKLVPPSFKKAIIRKVLEMAIGLVVLVLNEVLWKAKTEDETE